MIYYYYYFSAYWNNGAVIVTDTDNTIYENMFLTKLFRGPTEMIVSSGVLILLLSK